MRIVRLLGAALVVIVVVITVVAVIVAVAPATFGQVDRHRESLRPRIGARLGMLGDGSEIGASVRDVDAADVSREKLGAPAGAVIENVRADGPASKAGLETGDIVVEFDGERIRSARHLIRLVRETPDGRAVKATVVRQGRRVEVTITPKTPEPHTFTFSGDALRESLRGLEDLGRGFAFEIDPPLDHPFGRGRLGIGIQELTPQLASYFGAKDGVLVTSVGESSPGEKAGLKAGDVITSVNDQAIRSRSDLTRALRDAEDKGRLDVSIEVVRDKKTMTLKATLEERPSRRVRVTRAA